MTNEHINLINTCLKNRTQEQLTQETGIDQGTISRIKNGRREITLFVLVRLCPLLDNETVINFLEGLHNDPRK